MTGSLPTFMSAIASIGRSHRAVTLGCVGLVALLSVTLQAQAPAPSFEVVSIKINRTASRSSGTGPRPGGGIAATNSTVRSLILWAWELNDLELIGGPDWIDQVRFDILATAMGAPDLSTTRAMTRAMLGERFNLVLRKEMRRRPIYSLVV